MHSLTISAAIFLVVALIHFSYVDFRFRHVDGIVWFWLMRPAPPLVWVSRAAIAAALLLSLSAKFVGTSELFAAVLAGLVLIHIASLIFFEVRHR